MANTRNQVSRKSRKVEINHDRYTLNTILQNDLHNKPRLTINERLVLSLDVLFAFKAYVVEKKIIHRNIHPAYFLLEPNTLKDMQLTYSGKEISIDEATLDPTSKLDNQGIVGEICYDAPEIYTDEAIINQASDLYSIGRILFQLWALNFDETFESRPKYEELYERIYVSKNAENIQILAAKIAGDFPNLNRAIEPIKQMLQLKQEDRGNVDDAIVPFLQLYMDNHKQPELVEQLIRLAIQLNEKIKEYQRNPATKDGFNNLINTIRTVIKSDELLDSPTELHIFVSLLNMEQLKQYTTKASILYKLDLIEFTSNYNFDINEYRNSGATKANIALLVNSIRTAMESTKLKDSPEEIEYFVNTLNINALKDCRSKESLLSKLDSILRDAATNVSKLSYLQAYHFDKARKLLLITASKFNRPYHEMGINVEMENDSKKVDQLILEESTLLCDLDAIDQFNQRCAPVIADVEKHSLNRLNEERYFITTKSCVDLIRRLDRKPYNMHDESEIAKLQIIIKTAIEEYFYSTLTVKNAQKLQRAASETRVKEMHQVLDIVEKIENADVKDIVPALEAKIETFKNTLTGSKLQSNLKHALRLFGSPDKATFTPAHQEEELYKQFISIKK